MFVLSERWLSHDHLGLATTYLISGVGVYFVSARCPVTRGCGESPSLALQPGPSRERISRTENALPWDGFCPTAFDFSALSLSPISLLPCPCVLLSANGRYDHSVRGPLCGGAWVKDGVSPSRTVYGEGNGVGEGRDSAYRGKVFPI
jgi:hypothetical protein